MIMLNLTNFCVPQANTRQVAHQEVEISNIVRQAQSLGVPLLGVPLITGPASSYKDRVQKAVQFISTHSAVKRLCFGDLHLEHIRQWRLDNLSRIAEAAGAQLHFPVWHVPYEDLLQDLEESGVPCAISAVTIDGGPGRQVPSVGQEYCRELAESLPEDVDWFGENGEFHTLAQVWLAPAAGLSGLP